jgi:hypothetical protein
MAHADPGAADLQLHELARIPGETAAQRSGDRVLPPGAGTSAIYCDPENDLVVVVRWIERPARRRRAAVLAAIRRP